MQAQQAKGFCQGCLDQFHLFFLHPKPLAQGLQGLMSRALTWRRAKTLRKVPLPGRLREFCPPAQLYNPIGLPPFKQSKDWRLIQRGKDGW